MGRILLEITLKRLDTLGLRHLILVEKDLQGIDKRTIVDALARLCGRAKGLQHLTTQGAKGFDRGEVLEQLRTERRLSDRPFINREGGGVRLQRSRQHCGIADELTDTGRVEGIVILLAPALRIHRIDMLRHDLLGAVAIAILMIGVIAQGEELEGQAIRRRQPRQALQLMKGLVGIDLRLGISIYRA